jgi:phage terminase small subunit
MLNQFLKMDSEISNMRKPKSLKLISKNLLNKYYPLKAYINELPNKKKAEEIAPVTKYFIPASAE